MLQTGHKPEGGLDKHQKVCYKQGTSRKEGLTSYKRYATNGAQPKKEEMSMTYLDRESMAEDIRRRYDALTDYEQRVLAALLEVTDYELEETLDYVERGEYEFWAGVDSMAELAYKLVHDWEWGDPTVLENLDHYIYVDYEKLGEDLFAHGWRKTIHGMIKIW